MAAFIIDKEELYPGLIIFRRADVQHRKWYCRVKLPKVDRYKTVSLKTEDITSAKAEARKQDMKVHVQLESGIAVFNRPFRDLAKEYLAEQRKRAARGEISAGRVPKVKAVIDGPLDDYVGSTQVHLIGDELWGGYVAWRRENGAGRNRRNGVREVSEELAAKLAAKDAASRERALRARGIRYVPPKVATQAPNRLVAFISDATIDFELSIFGAVMGYGIKKRYVPASERFDERPKLKTMRRDEFTQEEYRKLHTVGRKWIKDAVRPSSLWYRTVTYNFILIMCNTGMRPSEAKNLRWRDITTAKDRDGREIVVLFVQGKGKSRKLVAPTAVGDYLDRVRAIAVATGPDDRVFTTSTGEPAKSLYQSLIENLLIEADLREGASGIPRSTYCFRHTYATFRLSEGVDVYFLAEQMGTSVKMIEDHYGHVNTIKNADLVLRGMQDWGVVEPVADAMIAAQQTAKARARDTSRSPGKSPTRR